ncbi:MAG: response regulator [Planctomycetes bacterium]|nr:response regulator [Planctomycetota bacterium]
MFAVHLVMVGVFGFLAVKDPDARHMRLWAISWGVGTARYLAALVGQATGAEEAANRLAYLTLLVSGVLFMAGTYRYLQRELPRGWVGGALAAAVWVVVCWALDAAGRGLPFLVETLPTFFFAGCVDLWTGAVILRSRELGSVRHVMGWALVVWGVHRYDYPFLRPVPGLAPWGFGLASFLGVIVAVGMLLLYFERGWAELRRSEARYRSIFENAIEGMFQVAPSGRFLTANPALVRMLGYGQSEELRALSLTADLLGEPDPDPRSRLDALVVASEPDGVETELRGAGDTRCAVHLHLRAAPDGEGGHYEGWVRDVTHAKRLQEQLLRSQKLEALGRLAGGVAHDFNNMLTAILVGSELAEAACETGDDPRPELRLIRDAGESAAALTRQLLTLGRNQQHLPAAGVVPLDLNDAVASAVAILGRLIGEDIRLEVSLASQTLRVRANAAQLEQLVLNLAINARDAMPEGGGLYVSTALLTRAGESRAQLVVRDEGVGIDPEARARLFDPFFTTKPLGKGTGLGLATVYSTLTSLGGEIEVTSAPGHGATFQVLLPLCEEEPASEPAPAPSATAADATVLLVEDDASVRKVTERLLRGAGYDVLVADDMGHGLAVARAHPGALNALVSDIVMPGGSGVELARALLEERPELRVLFVSGYADQELEGLRALPQAAFLAKPFTSEQLSAALGALLSPPSG